MKKILLLLASLLWMGFWWSWYTCKICTTCGCNQTTKTVEPILVPEEGVILFNLDDSITLLREGWSRYRDSIINHLNARQEIDIEGHYLAEEPNISSFQNMGLARANAIKQLFPDSLQSRINLKSLQIERRASMSQYPFVASDIRIVNQSESVEQVGDKTLIYFKYNSDQRINDPDIEKYLSELAAQHKNTNASFNITGHTDNAGSEKDNLALGKMRAEAIKKYLISKGIAADRIHTDSKGESMPVADNDTPEGRQKNRRTEIETIQKL